jgi:hypothetical protein
MADAMDVDPPATSKKQKEGSAGKDSGKARFEVKKVCPSSHGFVILYAISSNRYLHLYSGMLSPFGLGVCIRLDILWRRLFISW